MGTDVSTYRISFIFNGQLVHEGCTGLLDPEDVSTLIIEMFGTGYPKTQHHILTSVRYSAQLSIAQTVDNC